MNFVEGCPTGSPHHAAIQPLGHVGVSAFWSSSHLAFQVSSGLRMLNRVTVILWFLLSVTTACNLVISNGRVQIYAYRCHFRRRTRREDDL